ncbi:MAG: hypothetical protein A2Y62_19415 [Candidatus Fischerbacteria bacterium RBG_13_37_8]|uniref:HD-GYP domain-containing protein n=1 Tax=Candidatus Fischerbacteria bacterium RBG_13_37_8 TaxID=1817863 RepID=A0A1F5VN32_9BACT|nr:MAG: hypothetical protein A2Y62_19415 [Candidatus Fischerbacteria bacterium RBG_13_37_8]
MEIRKEIKKLLQKRTIKVKEIAFYYEGIIIPDNVRIKKVIKELLRMKKCDGFCFVGKGAKGFIFELERKDYKKFEHFLKTEKDFILLLLSLMVSYFKNGCSLDVIERAKVTTEVDEMCGELLKGICQIMNVDYGAIFSYDRTTDTIHALRPGYYLTDEDIGFFNPDITEDSWSYKAMMQGKTYVCNNVTKNPCMQKNLSEFLNIKRIACTPIFAQHELFGFLFLARNQRKLSFTNGEILCLDHIVTQLSSLLQSIITISELRMRSEAFINLEEAVRAISTEIHLTEVFDLIVKTCARLFVADAASLMMLDENGEKFIIKSSCGLSAEYVEKQFIPAETVTAYAKSHGMTPHFFRDITNTRFGNKELLVKEKLKSVIMAPLVDRGTICGLLNVYSRKERLFKKADMEVVHLYALEAMIAIKNAGLYQHKQDTIDGIVTMLSQLEAEQDQYTSNHSQRVADFAVSIGKLIELSGDALESLKIAALLHDFGKIAIDKNILHKPDILNMEEWLEVKRHPEIARDIISKIKEFYKAGEYIYYHHERYDGEGYPARLKGDEIPVEARVLCIADAIESMLSDRPYRKALSTKQVRDELIKEKGKQFDPVLVEIALSLL